MWKKVCSAKADNLIDISNMCHSLKGLRARIQVLSQEQITPTENCIPPLTSVYFLVSLPAWLILWFIKKEVSSRVKVTCDWLVHSLFCPAGYDAEQDSPLDTNCYLQEKLSSSFKKANSTIREKIRIGILTFNIILSSWNFQNHICNVILLFLQTL